MDFNTTNTIFFYKKGRLPSKSDKNYPWTLKMRINIWQQVEHKLTFICIMIYFCRERKGEC